MSKSVVPVGSERAVSRAEASPFALLQDEINRLFEGFGRNFPTLAPNAALPRIDVSETNESIDITAELPGLEAKDVQLNLSDNVLSIRGEKKSEHEDRQKDYHLVERSFGSFARSVQLPEGVKAEDVTAEISKVVLRVTVKKPRPKQRKQIEIKAA